MLSLFTISLLFPTWSPLSISLGKYRFWIFCLPLPYCCWQFLPQCPHLYSIFRAQPSPLPPLPCVRFGVWVLLITINTWSIYLHLIWWYYARHLPRTRMFLLKNRVNSVSKMKVLSEEFFRLNSWIICLEIVFPAGYCYISFLGSILEVMGEFPLIGRPIEVFEPRLNDPFSFFIFSWVQAYDHYGFYGSKNTYNSSHGEYINILWCARAVQIYTIIYYP